MLGSSSTEDDQDLIGKSSRTWERNRSSSCLCYWTSLSLTTSKQISEMEKKRIPEDSRKTEPCSQREKRTEEEEEEEEKASRRKKVKPLQLLHHTIP